MARIRVAGAMRAERDALKGGSEGLTIRRTDPSVTTPRHGIASTAGNKANARSGEMPYGLVAMPELTFHPDYQPNFQANFPVTFVTV